MSGAAEGEWPRMRMSETVCPLCCTTNLKSYELDVRLHPGNIFLPRNCKKKLPVSSENVITFAKLEIELSPRPLHPPDPENVPHMLFVKFFIPVAPLMAESSLADCSRNLSGVTFTK